MRFRVRAASAQVLVHRRKEVGLTWKTELKSAPVGRRGRHQNLCIRVTATVRSQPGSREHAWTSQVQTAGAGVPAGETPISYYAEVTVALAVFGAIGLHLTSRLTILLYSDNLFPSEGT
jgi:hypothetical protein